MSRPLRVTLTLVLILGQFITIPFASADALDSCRVKASQGQNVSLGFPIRPERLVYVAKPKILVIPFKLKDNPNYSFTDEYKDSYQGVASKIEELSQGKTSVEFVFAPTILTELTNADMDTLKINQQLQWQKDESKSTWGFVRKFIADQDSKIDYTGINAVILVGSSTSRNSYIAEAMMFHQNSADPWFRLIQTAEGSISNVVLLDKQSPQLLVVHEIMHLYGLTDLYGGPLGPGDLTLMANNKLNLLTYEKWVLGWHPDTEVTCLDKPSNSSIAEFTLDNSKSNQLIVIRALSGSTYIVETTQVSGNKYLAFYALDNEARPPITLARNSASAQVGVLIDSYTSIGTQLISPEFTLLFTDLNSSTITLNLISSSLTLTAQLSELVEKLKLKQEENAKVGAKLRAEQELQARAAAELKAKQDAEAKAAAELKAKQEAEALAAAELKAKQEAEAKAKAAELAAAKKMKTITCTKGKLTKKVTSAKPVCPSGYKKK